MKVGLFPGKFNLVHQGHVKSMLEAYSMVDHLYIVILYDEEFEAMRYQKAGIKSITPVLRERWWRMITKDLEHITVFSLPSPNTFDYEDWKKSSQEMLALTGPITHIFSGESSYEAYFKLLYPGCQIETLERASGNSVTAILERGIKESWDLLPAEVRPYFVKRVAILGAESSGKTTLTRKLAHWYQTEKVEEYGRILWEEYGGGLGTVFDLEDYRTLTYRQKTEESEKVKTARNYLFIDTETIVTQVWLSMYEAQELAVLNAIAEDESYDAYLLIQPDLDFIQDGTRNYESQRWEIYQQMKTRLEATKKKYTILTGDANQIFMEARNVIDQL
ncbi:AAA family ATPase [Carnobacterium gallinarum]|uniref:AAA family ATPase n=1 Tax=Carnobacterium gallinarum TaxID=2749 RepID=UPI0005516C13|nr:AAA family ATPase [Carnobacterium gallinarum]